MITALYLTRGQNITPQIVQAWGAFLTTYDISKVKTAFQRYIKYGDNFPSLPAIIALIEHRVDSDTASIEAWSNVLKAVKEHTSKGMTKAEKLILDKVEPNGLTGYMDASDFKRGEIGRDFKKMYKSAYDGINRELRIDGQGEILILQSAEHKPMIENNGMFKNE